MSGYLDYARTLSIDEWRGKWLWEPVHAAILLPVYEQHSEAFTQLDPVSGPWNE
jgi:hypothetical protein